MSAALQAVKQFRIREVAPHLKNAGRPRVPNPFLPRKNEASGRWAPAKYSLRRQADLVKHARASGTLHLLPPGPKLPLKELAAAQASASAAPVATASPSSKAKAATASSKPWLSAEVQWKGEYKEKKVKGADVGARLYAGKKRMFKGHKWERTMEQRMQERKMLMKDMEQRIERFRTVSAPSLFPLTLQGSPCSRIYRKRMRCYVQDVALYAVVSGVPDIMAQTVC